MTNKNIAFLAILGIAVVFGFQVNSQTVNVSGGLSLTEMTEHKKSTLDRSQKYTGPQTVQALMEAFDETYDRNHLKTTVIVSRKASGEASGVFILTVGETDRSYEIDDVEGKRYVSQFTTAEIDAQYPRAVWLQLLLDKGLTIENFHEYVSYLSKRHILAFLESHPNLRKTGLFGISPTADWETYKIAYIDKLVKNHIQIRKAAEGAERAKQQAERAKAQMEHTKQRVKHAKAQAERIKVKIERRTEEIRSNQGHPERIELKFKMEPSPKEPKWNRIKKSRYPAL